ncbi:MAG: hypothetical protein WC668_00095 [Patescibacteria group bacterium]|jgi:hypothetical protein
MIPFGTVVKEKSTGILRLVVPAPQTMRAAFGPDDQLTVMLRQYGPDIRNSGDLELIGKIDDPEVVALLQKTDRLIMS